MRIRSLRGRVLVLLVLAMTFGMVVDRFYGQLPMYVLDLEPDCLTTSQPVEDPCDFVRTLSPVFSTGAWALGAVLLVLLALPVAKWLLAPIADLVPVIDKVGPQNLGYRVRPAGPRHDELTRLGHSLDDMMDRISAGYEGQRRFAANASHELRTPLALQRTLIEVGMAEPLTPEQSALLASQLLQTNVRNERLVEGLLVLSQADQGLAARTRCRLDTIAAETVTAHQGLAAGAGVTLATDLHPCTVPGDAVLLERLVRNLVHNAIKYNHPGGTVTVRAGGTPALTVTNTGTPVPAEDVARLFEPFTRLATDRIDHSGGSGLGLAIARSVVTAHHGTITATPAPGGGLTITVDLPT
ncbi:ATP-binding protein [Actinoplanes sp. NPDC051494]|uniref:HAMP domain-containing sensor histidine kinase n=1 Tax=Actinoplanes sp. NPDC051494 TaxID=3363907 RepID=UPI0037B97562